MKQSFKPRVPTKPAFSVSRFDGGVAMIGAPSINGMQVEASIPALIGAVIIHNIVYQRTRSENPIWRNDVMQFGDAFHLALADYAAELERMLEYHEERHEAYRRTIAWLISGYTIVPELRMTKRSSYDNWEAERVAYVLHDPWGRVHCGSLPCMDETDWWKPKEPYISAEIKWATPPEEGEDDA